MKMLLIIMMFRVFGLPYYLLYANPDLDLNNEVLLCCF